MTKPKLIFNEGSLPFVLKALGCEIDQNGYVVYIEDKSYVLDQNGQKFLSTKLIGMSKYNWITGNE